MPNNSNPPLAKATIELTTGIRHLVFRPETSDLGNMNQILKLGYYDLRLLTRYAEMQNLIERKRTENLRPFIIDAGANIGAATVFLHGLFPTASFASIE